MAGGRAGVRRWAGAARRLAVLLALVWGAAMVSGRPSPAAAGQGVLYSWVEAGPAGRVFLRSVTTATLCPVAQVDGRMVRMQTRAAPSEAFPVLVCEARLDGPGGGDAVVDGQLLRVPQPDPERILVIGDSGCRMRVSSSGGTFQACNDPQAWPFKQVADRAAAFRPDLIVHVGDYHYREAPCPAGNAGCEGNPSGYSWASWEADFFAPAATLLPSAPWVFVRGNHEDCARAWEGWMRLLDPLPFTSTCQDYTEPYIVPLSDLQLLMLDSSLADDFTLQQEQVDAYRTQLQSLFDVAAASPKTRDLWLLTHDPLWVFGHLGVQDGVEQLFQDNMNLQAAARGILPDALQLALSGHIHLFQALDFGGARPPQLVVGNSGTALDPPITTPLAGQVIDGMAVTQGTVIAQRFGYATMERAKGGAWLVSVRGVNDDLLATCTLTARRLLCGG